jgi:hypothetical protein
MLVRKVILESLGNLRKPALASELDFRQQRLRSCSSNLAPSWEAVQHQEKHLVEVASLEWWGVRIKQGELGIVLLLEAVGTFG